MARYREPMRKRDPATHRRLLVDEGRLDHAAGVSWRAERP